ncbi:glutamate racemase [Borrelia miyamotoi]|uniref:glutamate racemase n=1 Tax=Borrelia miyamotoi TaxID=47466 RepID=UPI001C78090C|nr:glutamate racemase [Borrelia miyamotoi]BCR17389.1 Glutamate racemase [Borrelia miyamotoi]BCR18220.1 Glutamate racemase [Borrelia miyamotoi]
MNDLEDVIVIFDSGIGGLSYFEYITRRFVRRNYVYIADNKNFPYGEKTPEFLLKEILELILRLEQMYNIASIVIACNTASISVYNKLSFNFPIIYTLPSIGLVEELAYKKVILIATNATISSEFVQREKNCHWDLILKSAGELVKFVEHGDKFKEDALRLLRSLKLEVEASRRDVVFLGCTHYLHIKDMIESFLEVPVYDNRDFVTNELAKSIKTIESSDYEFRRYFYLTRSNNLFFYKNFCARYGLYFKGIID